MLPISQEAAIVVAVVAVLTFVVLILTDRRGNSQ